MLDLHLFVVIYLCCLFPIPNIYSPVYSKTVILSSSFLVRWLVSPPNHLRSLSFHLLQIHISYLWQEQDILEAFFFNKGWKNHFSLLLQALASQLLVLESYFEAFLCWDYSNGCSSAGYETQAEILSLKWKAKTYEVCTTETTNRTNRT